MDRNPPSCLATPHLINPGAPRFRPACDLGFSSRFLKHLAGASKRPALRLARAPPPQVWYQVETAAIKRGSARNEACRPSDPWSL
jgi:hypothetical protein